MTRRGFLSLVSRGLAVVGLAPLAKFLPAPVVFHPKYYSVTIPMTEAELLSPFELAAHYGLPEWDHDGTTAAFCGQPRDCGSEA